MSQPMNSQGSNQAGSNSNYQQVLQPVNNPPPHQPRPYTQPMPGSQYQQRVGPGPHRVLTVNRNPNIRYVGQQRPQTMQRRPDEMGGYGRPQPEETKLISKNKLVLLAKDIDRDVILEDDVIDLLLTLSEDFIDTVVSGSCALAKHRKCQTLDTADVKLCLSQQWDLQIPGFPVEDTKHKKQQTGEAHKQRLALIRKQLKR